MVLAKVFWILTLKSKAAKSKINKWDYITLKSFCTAKETINKMKRQPTKREKIFANQISDKMSTSKMYKLPVQLNSKISKTLI